LTDRQGYIDLLRYILIDKSCLISRKPRKTIGTT